MCIFTCEVRTFPTLLLAALFFSNTGAVGAGLAASIVALSPEWIVEPLLLVRLRLAGFIVRLMPEGTRIEVAPSASCSKDDFGVIH